MRSASDWVAARVPFYYGWVVIAVAFVTMGIGVNSRTAFSLLYPPILDEFGWERGVTAAAFSLGFAASVAFAPFAGVLMDRLGPRYVISIGAALVSSGLVLATFISTPLHLYLTLGGLVVGSSVFMSYIGHSAFLPRWFDRKRGFAIGVAYSGVGVGSIVLFPLLQEFITDAGWREACITLGVLIVVTIIPLNLALQRTQPQDLGLAPDGDRVAGQGGAPSTPAPDNVVDHAWVATEWTIGRALRTPRYWWLFFGHITAMYVWYAVQVHQTRYLVEVGFSVRQAAFALGLVGLTGIVGQIGLGHLSDRLGRELSWAVACAGFALCYGLLIVLGEHPSVTLMVAVAAAQGFLGYGVAPIYSAIAADLFQGKHFGAVFGTISVASTLGAASGPWVTGFSYDRTGSYTLGFALALGCAVTSAVCIWLAAPRKVRLVAGRAAARAARSAGLTHPPRLNAVAIRATPIELPPGQERTLTARALGPGGRRVEGPVRYTWSLDAGLGTLHPHPRDGARITLRAGKRPGTTRLTVTAHLDSETLTTTRRVRILGVGP